MHTFAKENAMPEHREPEGTHNRIHAVVRRIPPGRVSTYGDVAVLAGMPGQARLVGYALHALPPHSTVPWHRVINARGRISVGRAVPGGELVQRRLLEAEGVEFDARGAVALVRFRWGGGEGDGEVGSGNEE